MTVLARLKSHPGFIACCTPIDNLGSLVVFILLSSRRHCHCDRNVVFVYTLYPLLDGMMTCGKEAELAYAKSIFRPQILIAAIHL